MCKRLLYPMVVLVIGGGLLWWTLSSPFWQTVQRVAGVMRLLHEEYVDPDRADYEELGEAAIRGMVGSLDPYSVYLSPRDFSDFELQSQQQYIGIGVEIERLQERVTLVTVLPGGPAEKAGLLAGDRILEVDGTDVREAGVGKVSDLLRGEEGAPVRIEVERPASSESLTFQLDRGQVRLSTVRGVSLSPDEIGYLRIAQFGEKTPEEFAEVVNGLHQRGMQGLVVDLRDNPGGLLRTAKAVAGFYLEPGQEVVRLRGRDLGGEQVYRASGRLGNHSYPIAVLLNESSASGAEIVAGVWQDTGTARLVGETSHGKGSVQSVYGLGDGSGLRQTTARYYLPSGRSIDKVGVEPDILVEESMEAHQRRLLQRRHRSLMDAETFAEVFGFPPDQTDAQLRAARRWLREELNLPRPG
ncbi:MAG: PDZ domain-containing protein [Verrucomicrobia bacterium]|jgi:carboxyl-terminal processing protease|nr:PDZ domain-containing protein [Verrucomicrobiota bacterium]